MPYYASKEFRMNCYDKNKKQRVAFVSDDVLITNEHVTSTGGVHFHLVSMNNDSIKFGETPESTVSLSFFNEDGQFSREDLLNREFSCYMGVEVSGRADNIFSGKTSACEVFNDYTDAHHKNVEWFGLTAYDNGRSVLHTNCYLFSSYGWTNGAKKIVYAYGYLYFVGVDPNDPSVPKYWKIRRTAPYIYELLGMVVGDTPNNIISEREIKWLERFRISDIDGMSLFDKYMIEYKIADNTVPTDFSSWGALHTTWGASSLGKWGDHFRFGIYDYISYEVVQMGVWEFEPPRRVRESIVTITGRDRMHRFDVDSIDYAKNIGLTNISVRDQAITMSNYTGVPCDIPTMRLNTLANNTMCNPSNYYSSKTIKDLLSYCFEVGANNAVIDRYGILTGMNPSTSYPTYSSEPTVVGVTHFYSLDQAEIEVGKINKVLTLKQGDTVMLETIANDGETYDWYDNPFFNGNIAGSSWFSNGMTDKLSGYQPMIFSADADYTLWCDDVCPVLLDGVWVALPIFSMDIDWCGTGIVTYEVGGEEHREREIANYSNRIESVASTNDTNMQGLNKAQYANKLYFDENGLTVESQGLVIKNANGETVFSADDDGNLTLTGTINADAGHIGVWDIDSLGIVSEKDGAIMHLGAGETSGSQVLNLGMIIKPDNATKVCFTSLGIEYYDNNNTLLGRFDYSYPSNMIEVMCPGTNGTARIQADVIQIFGGSKVNVYGTDIIFSSPIWLSGVNTTTSSANTVLVSGTNGRQFYIVSSLRKNKENIKTIENASEKVDNLRGVSFTSKCEVDDPNVKQYGFIAEEVEKAVPELASYSNGELASVQYDRVCALLVEDNKECHRRIRELEERLKKVEEMLDGIHGEL